uniref:Uncharacterized protein n=1 Tax=Oryza rufipogon TaxID=4529 RepID=A0A0E0MR63_ORYRU
MHRVAMAAAAAGDGGDGRGRTLGAVIKEKDEELALFLEMRRREKERGAAAAAAAAEQLLLSGDRVDVARDGMLLVDQPPPRPQPPAEHKAAAYRMTGGFRRAPGGADDFLNSDGGDKNDYDWLLTPPGTPLFPSLEESKKSPVSQTGTPKTRPTALKSRLANHPDPPSRTTLPLRATSSNNLNSAATTRRPSSSGGHTSNSSRPSTPTGRPALTNTSKGQHLLQQGQQHLQEHLALLPGHQFLQVIHTYFKIIDTCYQVIHAIIQALHTSTKQASIKVINPNKTAFCHFHPTCSIYLNLQTSPYNVQKFFTGKNYSVNTFKGQLTYCQIETMEAI